MRERSSGTERVGTSFFSPSLSACCVVLPLVPGVAPGVTGSLRSVLRPATAQAADVAALMQFVRSEVSDVRMWGELGGCRVKGGEAKWTRMEIATTAHLIVCSL